MRGGEGLSRGLEDVEAVFGDIDAGEELFHDASLQMRASRARATVRDWFGTVGIAPSFATASEDPGGPGVLSTFIPSILAMEGL